MRCKFLRILCLAVLPFTAAADTFYGPTTTTNKLIVPTNEVAIITSVMAADVVSGDVMASNSSYAVRLPPSGSVRYAVAGPAELRITTPSAIYFRRLQNAAVKMALLAGGDTTNGVLVSVPAGKTIEVFGSLNTDVIVNSYVVKSGLGSNLVQIVAGNRLDGPVELRLYTTTSVNAATFSWWFVEDVFQNPNLLVPAQSQAPQILVEKSADLQGWVPVGFFGQSLGSNTFYRLRIAK